MFLVEQASPELSRVIATFESAVPSRDLLPTTVASLPQEILARIAELIAIPRALGRSAHAAEDDEEGDSGEASSARVHYRALVAALIHRRDA